MAIRFLDGFDHYNGSEILYKWTNFISTSAGGCDPSYSRQRGVGQGLFISGGAPRGYYYIDPSSTDATWTIGAAVYFPTLPVNANSFMALYNNAGEQCSVRGDGAGHLTVCRGTTVLATSTNTVSTSTWYYIEFKATCATGTGGTVELRVNGTSVGWVPSTGSLNTAASGVTSKCTGFSISTSGGTSIYFDDLYALDSTGSVNTTFLGDTKVLALRPTANGSYAQWTANGGNNFGNVQDDPYPDFDGTFNQSATANQIDSFGFVDLPISSGSVFAIQQLLWGSKDVGSARSVAPLQRSSSTDYVGNTYALGTSYLLIREVHETNPDTSAAWTISGVNGAEFGYKLIS